MQQVLCCQFFTGCGEEVSQANARTTEREEKQKEENENDPSKFMLEG